MTRPRGLGRLLRRLLADYGSPGRGEEYLSILRLARDRGYRLLSLEDFVACSRDGGGSARCVILRHDVDIDDVPGNEAFFRAELEVGARATYYFRLSTARTHLGLIERLRDAGFEVGYHFEEGATLAKQWRWRSREEVFGHRDEIVSAFRQNCESIRNSWSPALRSVAAHGDWINRKLGFINNELIDRRTLAECGLAFEAYDSDIRDAVDTYVSDVATPPQKWTRGVGPIDEIRAGRCRLYMLTHERRWHPGRLAKASADAGRLRDAVRYFFRR
jgi:hypothetical protein